MHWAQHAVRGGNKPEWPYGLVSRLFGTDPVLEMLTESLVHFIYFRQGPLTHVRMVLVALHKVLVILLGRIETIQRLECGDDWLVESLALLKLANVQLGCTLLLLPLIENGGAILSAPVQTLAIEMRRVMCGEENFQQLIKADLCRVVGDLDRLGVVSLSRRDGLVSSRRLGATRVAGHHVAYAFELREHCFYAPETTAREHS